MKGRSEGDKINDFTRWRGPERAEACLTARRARGGSTPCEIIEIGGRSSSFMNSPG